jgi:hypothetical protein
MIISISFVYTIHVSCVFVPFIDSAINFLMSKIFASITMTKKEMLISGFMIYSSVVSFILIESSLIPEGRRSSWIFISFVIIPSFWYPGPLLINYLCSSFFNLLVGI